MLLRYPGAWERILRDFGDVRAWIELKNEDDSGTPYDLRAELYRNGSLMTSGVTLCIQEVSRNPATAKKVTPSALTQWTARPPCTLEMT